MDAVSRLLSRGAGEEIAVAFVPSFADLPAHWLAYDAVDQVLLLTRGVEEELAAAGAAGNADSAARRARVAALTQWVRLGGRLTVSVSGDAAAAFTPGGPLADLVPGDVSRVTAMRATTGLETWMDAGPVLIAERDERPTVAVLETFEGEALVYEEAGVDARPLVVRKAYGFGEVVFVAFDIQTPVIRDWPGLPRMLARLLQTSEPIPADEYRRRAARSAQRGYFDVAGQLWAALDVFPGVRQAPFSMVVLALLAFVAVVGPAEYWLVRRLGVAWLSWTVFPVACVGFAALFLQVTRMTKADRPLLNQATVIDLDVATGTVRGGSWAHLYYPRSARLDVSVETSDLLASAGSSTPAAPPVETGTGLWLCWDGLGGPAFGGMESGSWRASPGGGYEIQPHGSPGKSEPALRRVPMMAHGTKAVRADWAGRWNAAAAQADFTVDRAGKLQGRAVSPLAVPLRDASLFFDRWVYPVGDLPPGGSIRIDGLSHRTGAQTWLQDSGASPGGGWNAEKTDAAAVLQLAMFFRAAGGIRFAQLVNRRLGRYDVSHALENSRAVLVGKAVAGAADVRVGGQPLPAADVSSVTLVRIVFPVGTTEGVGSLFPVHRRPD